LFAVAEEVQQRGCSKMPVEGPILIACVFYARE